LTRVAEVVKERDVVYSILVFTMADRM